MLVVLAGQFLGLLEKEKSLYPELGLGQNSAAFLTTKDIQISLRLAKLISIELLTNSYKSFSIIYTIPPFAKILYDL